MQVSSIKEKEKKPRATFALDKGKSRPHTPTVVCKMNRKQEVAAYVTTQKGGQLFASIIIIKLYIHLALIHNSKHFTINI